MFQATGTAREIEQHAVNMLRGVLFSWYDEEERRKRFHTRVQQFTFEMVFGGDVIGTWGSETNALLLWSRTLLDRFSDHAPKNLRLNLHRGIHSAVGMYVFCTSDRGGVATPMAAQEFCNRAKVHLRAVLELNIAFKPKHHQLAHMCRKLLKCVTPALWGDWREEIENKDMKEVAKAAHYSVWERRILVNHRRAFGVRSSRHQDRGKRSRVHL